MTNNNPDRPRTALTPDMIVEQHLISKWAVLASWAWSELDLYGEMPESVRQELVATWSASWLSDQRMESFGPPEVD